MTPPPTLNASGLRKAFAGKTVVDGVNVSVGCGEVVGLLGPNGAGKTTTFYMIVGLLQAGGGRITLDGEDIGDLPMYQRARKGISYLPQEPSIFRKLTVEDNVLAVLEAHEEDGGVRARRAADILAELGLARLSGQKAFTLSGGERRRLEIARALATTPSFILLDEPFAGIDPIAIGDLQGMIGELKKRRIGVLISDHNVRDTLKVCDRAYIIDGGKIIEEGPPVDIARSARARQVYLGEGFEF